MRVTIEIFKLFLVLFLFSLPLYALGLFWGISYGEYYALLISGIISVIIIINTSTFFRFFFKVKHPLKNRRIIDTFYNSAFLMGLDRPKLMRVEINGPGIGFYKTFNGQNIILINPRAFESLRDNELNLLSSFILRSINESTFLRNSGSVFIYILGRPLYYLSKVKWLAIHAHFFFIPLKFLSNSLFATDNLFKNVFKLYNEDELRVIKSSLNKLAKFESSNSNVFVDQVRESCFLLKPKDETLYDLIIHRKKRIQDIFA